MIPDCFLSPKSFLHNDLSFQNYWKNVPFINTRALCISETTFVIKNNINWNVVWYLCWKKKGLISSVASIWLRNPTNKFDFRPRSTWSYINAISRISNMMMIYQYLLLCEYRRNFHWVLFQNYQDILSMYACNRFLVL